MRRLAKIARRTVLFGSVAVAGGVAFGLYTVRAPHDNPLAKRLRDGEATFNPWVKIGPNRITLIVPHADKGQGAASAQAALIAEELDVEFGQFHISFGQPSAAYWNRALAEEGVPFMTTDESFMADAARGAVGGMVKLLGMQITGGSSTVPDGFDKLRQAGAVARETLKLAASKQTGIPVAQLRTAKAAVLLPDGSSIPYTELAASAAQVDPITDVPLRDPDQWRLIGKPMERLDILPKSTGTLDYGIDLTIEGMVYAAIKVNPRQGGSLISYDASTALKMRGVSQVVEIPGGVAVIADNTWRAFRAAEAIEFEWGPAPYPADQSGHWQTLEASFTDDRLDKVWRDDGDAETVLKNAEVLEAEYRSPYVAHAPLEPLSAIVKVTDDRVDVWTGHQVQRQLQVLVAGITGHNKKRIVLHNQFIGGSFGHRLEFEHVKQAAEIANQLRGTPVKLVYSREEDFAHDFPRHISIGRARGSIANGRVNAIDLQIAAPSVIASQMGRAQMPVPGPDSQLAAGAWNNPYAIPNYLMRAYRAPELAPVSSWRSVGAVSGGFFFDTFLDELIHAAGADPMEERIRLMEHDVSRKVLETVADMCSWGGHLEPNQARGVAFVESFGVPTAEVIQVASTEYGIRIEKAWCAADVGTVVDPLNFENLVQGGIVFGLGHAMNAEITYSDGMAEQSNYHAHEAMRLYQCPEIFVTGLENGHKVRGIGEPPVPPAAPALGNAIFAATGKRLREMPFNKHVDFV